jgi:acyl carrier protein
MLIERSVIEAVHDLIGREIPLAGETPLAELGIDSLTLVELVLALERRWTIELRPDDYDRIRTVGDVVALVSVH